MACLSQSEVNEVEGPPHGEELEAREELGPYEIAGWPRIGGL